MTISLVNNQKHTSRVTDALFEAMKGIDRGLEITYPNGYHKPANYELGGHVFCNRKALNKYLIDFANSTGHFNAEIINDAVDSYDRKIFINNLQETLI